MLDETRRIVQLDRLGILSEVIEPHREWNPLQRLMYAILQDAAVCYTRYASYQTVTQQREWEDAASYLWSDEEEWIFSAVNICEELDVDVSLIRKYLLSLLPQGVKLRVHSRTETYTHKRVL